MLAMNLYIFVLLNLETDQQENSNFHDCNLYAVFLVNRPTEKARVEQKC